MVSIAYLTNTDPPLPPAVLLPVPPPTAELEPRILVNMARALRLLRPIPELDGYHMALGVPDRAVVVCMVDERPQVQQLRVHVLPWGWPRPMAAGRDVGYWPSVLLRSFLPAERSVRLVWNGKGTVPCS